MLSGICRVCSKKTCEAFSPAWGMRMNEPWGNREGPCAGCLHVQGELSWVVSPEERVLVGAC